MRLNTNSLKRTVAVLAAVCTLGTCCIAGSIAYADGEKKEGANTADISSVCGVKDGTDKNCTSITIHKYSGATDTANDHKPNGTDVSSTVENNGNKPLKGVEFTLYKVQKDGKDIDLSGADGWKNIGDLTTLSRGQAASFFTGKNPKFTKVKVGNAKETDDSGKAEFTGLAESLYYVEETSTTKAQTKNDKGTWVPATVTYKTDPFFVTTPLSHKTDTSWEWLYNIHVFPKNDISTDTPTKTAADPDKYYVDKDGSTVIPWNISIPLSAPDDGKAYKKIGFVDSLPTGLTFKDVTDVMLVKTPKPTQETPKPNSSNLPLSDHEDKQKNLTKDYTASVKNGKVTFNLEDSKLADISKDFKDNTYVLKVTLNTKVADGTKNVTNFITGWIDDSKIGDGDENTPCVPTKQEPNKCDKNPHGSSHFATLKITKVAMNASKDTDQAKHLTTKTLKGAKFAVYVMKDQTAALNTVTADNLSTTADSVKTKDSKNPQLTIETGDDGTAKVDLFIGNGTQASSRKYCLVETDAPAGFKKDPTPHCYAVNAETDTNVTDGVATGNSQTIGNDQATELDKILAALPMTGARGLVLLTAFGIVGLGGTLFYIITRRRKEQEEA